MKKQTKSKIHIALAFNERFWAPAFATIRSICLTTRRRSDLVFHLCHANVSNEAIEALDGITKEFGAKIIYYNIEEDKDYQHFAKTLPNSKHLPPIAYARMLFDKIIDKKVERILYLDCDLLVRAPIENLAEIELDNYPIAAVKDVHWLRFSNDVDVACDRDLLDPADAYFNSGVMVIDLKKWRKMDMIKTLLSLEKSGKLPRLTHDMQILNYIFANNWKQLDKNWNMFGVHKAIEALDPFIVHYTGGNKPWNLINGLPFSRVYRHVMTNKLFYKYMRTRWKSKFFKTF